MTKNGKRKYIVDYIITVMRYSVLDTHGAHNERTNERTTDRMNKNEQVRGGQQTNRRIQAKNAQPSTQITTFS